MSPTVRFMSSNARPARAPDVVYTDHIESGGPFKQEEKKKIFFFSFFLSCCSTRKTAWCPARVIPTKPPSPPAGLEKHPRCLLGPSLRCCTGSSFYGLLQQVLCLYPTRFDRRKRGDKPGQPLLLKRRKKRKKNKHLNKTQNGYEVKTL